jgi:hypothetical protein
VLFKQRLYVAVSRGVAETVVPAARYRVRSVQGRLDIVSGGDSTLKGAVVSGNQVTAAIGGNLAVQSVQDTTTYNAKQQSAGASISLCIPPICYGASTGSASFPTGPG